MEHGSNMFKHITMINSETYVGTCWMRGED
jgi:hypothetical protein